MDLANPSYLGQAAQLTNVLPGVQQALLGEQQIQAQRLANEQAQHAMQQQQAFQADFAHTMANPSPQSIGTLMGRYPQFADKLKAGWEIYQGPAKESKFRLALDIHNLLANGQWDKASALLAQHQDADVQAGMAQPGEYQPLIEAINNKSPYALGMAAVTAASIYPEKYAENFKALNNPEGTSPVAREYNWRVQQFGKDQADAWLKTQDTKLVPVNPGGSVKAFGPDSYTQTAEGGDPSTGGQGDTALTFAQFKAYADVQGPSKAAEWANTNGLVIAVQTPAQAMNLPKGVHYSTPDGQVYVR